MRRTAVVAALFLLHALPAAAQSLRVPDVVAAGSDAQPAAAVTAAALDGYASEWMIAAGPALGVEVFHSVEGHRYLLQTISWGRVLTESVGSGVLRGRFGWAVEGVPIFGQFAPTDTFGLGLSPIVWRWNFDPRGPVAPFAELAGGVLWTRQPVPDRTTTVNFTAHIGAGVRYFLNPRRAVVVGYRFHHISNGNRLERNPGVNGHVFLAGISLVRPGR
jgi:hypothetical protein